jgi:phosphoribosylformylglycinamidine cyclo-ligase
MKGAYAKAGVDIDLADKLKDGLKAKLKRASRPEVLGGVGAFGGLFALDLKKYREPVLVSSMDGVGTKLRIAVQMGVHDTVGQDLVNHCCNDIAVMGAEPLFFLDYIGTGKLEPRVFDEVIAGLVKGCAAANVALLGGETAQMPGFYGDEEYDLVGTIIGCVERSKILDGTTVKKGDVLIALPSSGLHTNGYTLARRILFDELGLEVRSKLNELGGTIGEELLKVHVNYAPLLLKLAGLLHGAVHVTGGGFWGNIPRVVPEGLQARIKRGSWPVLPIFQFLQEKGKISEREMFEVFNMGAGMILAVSAKDVEKVTQIAKTGGFTTQVVGEIVDGQAENVELVD